MSKTATIPLLDGVKVIVPDTLNQITPYVLLEQQDWFEDEIKFLRRLLRPGERIVDIGANHGVYSLSMAQTVGAAGQLWAFEPTTRTADLLAASIAANQMSNVALLRCALSDHRGSAKFALNENSELNAVIHGESSGDFEVVELRTLDDCRDEFGLTGIAFVKMDAEGEESNILKGGARFFAEESPLVQYEIRAGNDFHLDLADTFRQMGYESYRLVPGLDLLVPFPDTGTPDPYLLNLFCCKADRAAQLAARGLLVTSGELEAAMQGDIRQHLAPRHGWEQSIGQLPYAAHYRAQWEANAEAPGRAALSGALEFHSLARDVTASPAVRYLALRVALDVLNEHCLAHGDFAGLSSLARIAADFGARQLATVCLQHLIEAFSDDQPAPEPAHPFLVAHPRFAAIPPGERPLTWLAAAIIERQEELIAFSSFFSGASSKNRLRLIRELGYASPEMQRRLMLVEARFPE